MPPLLVAATGPGSGRLAGEIGDGLISVGPNAEVVKAFDGAGGAGKPHIGKVVVCWAKTKAAARETVAELWPLPALPGVFMPNLRTVEHVEQAAQLVGAEEIADSIPALGPDPDEHLAAIRKVRDAGFEQIVVHQVGSDQAGFFHFYEREILSEIG